MSAKSKLKKSLSSIDGALRALKRARSSAPENQDIERAIRELEDAETEVNRALREVKRNED